MTIILIALRLVLIGIRSVINAVLRLINGVLKFVSTRRYEYVGMVLIPSPIFGRMGVILFRTGWLPVLCPIRVQRDDKERVASVGTTCGGLPVDVLVADQFFRFNLEEQKVIIYHEIGHVVKCHHQRKLAMKKDGERIYWFEVEADRYAANMVGIDQYLTMMWTLTEYIMDEAPISVNRPLFENLSRMSDLGDERAKRLKERLLKSLESLEEVI